MFKVGDVVKLKSGGPAMTVIEAAKPGFSGDTVSVSWFRNDGACDQARLPVLALTAVDPNADNRWPPPYVLPPRRAVGEPLTGHLCSGQTAPTPLEATGG